MGNVADHRSTAIMALHIEGGEVRPRQLDEICHPLIILRRRGRFLHEDVAFMAKKILVRRFDAALFLPRHGMAGDVVHPFGEPRRDFIPKIRLSAARIRHHRPLFQKRAHGFHHGHHLENRRAEVHNVRISHHRRHIRRRFIHRPAPERRLHGGM